MSSTTGCAGPARRTRRKPAEVRALLIEAAAAEYADRDVREVTAKSICERAGVAQSVMYRHFANKTELLRDALIAPLASFASEFGQTWQAQRTAPRDDYRLMRSFVDSLYGALAPRRESLAALVTASRHADLDVMYELRQSVITLFADLTNIGIEESGRRGWFSADDLGLAIRCITGIVLGYVAFEPLLMAGTQDEVSAERMLDEIAALVIWGLRRGPVDQS